MTGVLIEKGTSLETDTPTERACEQKGRDGSDVSVRQGT